ncbi:MAG: mannose-1-phosphate guanylyltransferase [Rhodospirillales bacterium]|nr:mannose-1-phosphate guanylyltransferase [Alphaproteobacteria bacterium]USO05551.1 MAG: mannose-1-phosphate guanylyltransferase [Rhodospirillales bacterium]
MSKADIKTVIPVILCGGSGTRLWPYSREDHPKQFLNLFGKKSLLQETIARTMRIADVPEDHIITVTLDDLRAEVVEQLVAIGPGTQNHILSEPSPRNTAAAVAYAALYIKLTFGDNAYAWILPADHHIQNEQALHEALAAALEAAEQDYIVTFGIQPTRPETGYGYINVGQPLEGASARKANAFFEKPDKETASTYLKESTYLWNSGMFLFQTGTVLRQFDEHAPEILMQVRKSMEAGKTDLPNAELYAEVAKQPFDKAIMEKTGDVAVVPCDPEWSDIGSWESLWEIREKDKNGNVIEERVVCHDTKNCMILPEGKRLVACAGIEDIVIIETPDALLIADRTNTNSLKDLVEKLKNDKTTEVLRKTFPDSA